MGGFREEIGIEIKYGGIDVVMWVENVIWLFDNIIVKENMR